MVIFSLPFLPPLTHLNRAGGLSGVERKKTHKKNTQKKHTLGLLRLKISRVRFGQVVFVRFISSHKSSVLFSHHNSLFFVTPPPCVHFSGAPARVALYAKEIRARVCSFSFILCTIAVLQSRKWASVGRWPQQPCRRCVAGCRGLGGFGAAAASLSSSSTFTDPPL